MFTAGLEEPAVLVFRETLKMHKRVPPRSA